MADNKYTKEDAMEGTNASKAEVNEAWHQAREDAQSVGELNERAENKGVDPVPHDKAFHDRAVESAQQVVDANAGSGK